VQDSFDQSLDGGMPTQQADKNLDHFSNLLIVHISTKQVEPILDGASISGTKHDTHFTMFSLMPI
jgi:hypothetical protein